VVVGAESYRTYRQGIKIKVGTTGTSVQVSYPDNGVIAHDDGYSVPQGTALNIAAPGVLGNDTVRGGLGLSAELVASVAHGTLDLHADGSFGYTPATGYSGMDSFL
jgi:hypothetical protein